MRFRQTVAPPRCGGAEEVDLIQVRYKDKSPEKAARVLSRSRLCMCKGIRICSGLRGESVLQSANCRI